MKNHKIMSKVIVVLILTSLTSNLLASSWYSPSSWMPNRETFTSRMPSSPQWANQVASGWANLSPYQQRAALATVLGLGGGLSYYGWNQRQQRLAEARRIAEEQRLAQISAKITDELLIDLAYFNNKLSEQNLTMNDLNLLEQNIANIAKRFIQPNYPLMTASDQQLAVHTVAGLKRKIKEQKEVLQINKAFEILNKFNTDISIYEQNIPSLQLIIQLQAELEEFAGIINSFLKTLRKNDVKERLTSSIISFNQRLGQLLVKAKELMQPSSGESEEGIPVGKQEERPASISTSGLLDEIDRMLAQQHDLAKLEEAEQIAAEAQRLEEQNKSQYSNYFQTMNAIWQKFETNRAASPGLWKESTINEYTQLLGLIKQDRTLQRHQKDELNNKINNLLKMLAESF